MTIKFNGCIYSSIQLIGSICLFTKKTQEHAYESTQKYKEGKYIIELAHMIKDNGWEEEQNEEKKR